MSVCNGCPHQAHPGRECKYPLELFAVPGRPAPRCDCKSLVLVAPARRKKGRSFKKKRPHMAAQ